MPVLTRFATPANLDELPPEGVDAWSARVGAMVQRQAARFPQFYDPTAEDTPGGLAPAVMAWPAFPARILREEGPGARRWQRADSSRQEQDEYCEWSVERDPTGKVTRITFTSEVPEYWQELGNSNPDLLLELYQQHVDGGVQRSDLFVGGRYEPRNRWNTATSGRLAHLIQQNNTLGAAVTLVAEATILRRRADGTPVTDRQELVICGRLGDPFRNSDPQIAEIVNDAAALGTEVTLLDPLGLYLDGLISAGMETPDGTDAATFWHIERGTPEHAVRASFAVPAELGYAVGDIRIGGRPISFGAQVADKVRVRITAVAKPGGHQPTRRPCGPA